MALATPLNQTLIKNQAVCIKQNQVKLLSITFCILLGGLLLIGWLNQWFEFLLIICLVLLLPLAGARVTKNSAKKILIQSSKVMAAILFSLALIAGCLNFGLQHPLTVLLLIINLIYNFLYFDFTWYQLMIFAGLTLIFCLILMNFFQKSANFFQYYLIVDDALPEKQLFLEADGLVLLVCLNIIFFLLLELKARLNWLKNHYYLYDLGLLSSSLNHQLFEPLQSSLHELELLQAQLPEISDSNTTFTTLRSKLNCIQSKLELMQRIAVCYQPLREQSKHQAEFLLSSCLMEALDILKFKIKNHQAKVILKLKTDALMRGDSGLLCQVLLNVIVNAIESFAKAVKRENKLIITTEKLTINTNRKQMIKLTITDNGCGMNRCQVISLKESYCSRKPKSGLGFYLANLIVEENFNGYIEIKSKPHQGTTIEIKLPVEEFGIYASNKEI